MSPGPRRRRLAVALLAAGAAHVLVIWWLARPDDGRDIAVEEPPPAATDDSVADTASVALVPVPLDMVPLGEVPESVLGTHDRAPAETGLRPDSATDRDLPGQRPASLGGGAVGGRDSFTGRNDREDFQTQAWDNARENRIARHGLADPDSRARARAPESLVRQQDPGFDSRTDTRVRARTGSASPTTGALETAPPGDRGVPVEQRDWRTADPMFTGTTGATSPQRREGRVGARGQALTERGPAATEAPVRGPVRDNQRVAGASTERDPAPVEMTRAQTGGRDSGVRGSRARSGVSREGTGRRGSAASTAEELPTGGPATVRARRRQPYFRRMYQRMDRYVEFPEELALSLRQGEVVVRFQLSAAGAISRLEVSKSSGYRAFDDQVLAAARRAAPFGQVPAELLQGQSSLRVTVPYSFKNPLIRQ